MRKLRLIHPIVWIIIGPALIALILAAAISAGAARSGASPQIHTETPE